MITHKTYVPILKWKQGEYQALLNLDERVKKHIVPLIEIPPIGFDHAEKRESKTLDEHIEKIGSRLKQKWGVDLCLIDFSQLQLQERTDGMQYVSKIFELYRKESCTVVPVIGLDCSENMAKMLKSIATTDGNGLCLRIKSKYLNDKDINEEIEHFLNIVSISRSEIDLLVDFEELPDIGQIESYMAFSVNSIRNIEKINLWRSFTVAGASFPKDTSKSSMDKKRLEWLFYNKCYTDFIDGYRLPAFSDYGINRPEHTDLDMRVIKPYAKMRYTLDDRWYINIGAAVRGPKSRGFGQFKELCQNLVAKEFFRGANYSAGDKHIFDCAEGKIGTGNLSTWVFVSTNQHLVKIVNDLANLYEFLI